ncbi:nickel-type superoxide dismutase maturation protease [Actinomadura pelletieri DSM 43383]|uniref:Nickel-type superoxide dismutase maturation protease n=1 Tax=Actinomadura pelletieri DSM 43383 TaxID=1120940 RepID=A0A495QHT6_9ACTN|nr:S24 family peptidase [Actinomadura pelletieri]RKS71712.1 nickel-type superoxide dismutase maturation protease [Actinomadura pelletieri DSM 43383]
MRHPAVWSVGVAVLVLVWARRRLLTVEVTGESMAPGLRPGDWLLVRAGVRAGVGDLVVARHPEREDVLIVKRAVRRSGDGWWLESDNQSAPGRRDSWDFGAVPDALIVGRVVGRYWPLVTRGRRRRGGPARPRPR